MKDSRVRFAPVGVDRADTPDGGFILRSRTKLEDYPSTLCHIVEHQAVAAADRDFLAERADDGTWRRVTYRAFRDAARAVAAGLLARGVRPGNPVMILSDNGIDNALMQFGAMYAGIPAAPVSPAYSLMSQDHAKLRFIFDLLKPKVVFAENGAAFAKALSVLDLDGVELVLSRNAPDGLAATAFSGFCQGGDPTSEVEAAFAGLGAGTVAKILFHVRLHRLPEGRHQHPWHDVLQPAGHGAGLAVPGGSAAGASRLVALASHVRRQSQSEHGAAQWRHALH